jgi:hypothetical protein
VEPGQLVRAVRREVLDHILDPQVRPVEPCSGTPHGLAVWANEVVAVGVLIAVLGVLSGSPVSGLGVLLAVVGLALCLAAAALEGLSSANDDGHISK